MPVVYRVYQLTRVHAAPTAACVYILGPVVAAHGHAGPWGTLVVLTLIGGLSHTYACTVNDIADVETDRLDVRRADGALTSGAISIRAAQRMAAVQLVTAVAAAALLPGAAVRTAAVTAVLFGSITFSNVYQKRRVLPPLAMDMIFGFNLGFPATLIWFARFNAPALPAVLFGSAFGAQMVLLNVIAGNLKDLTHDRRVGSATTALDFGVTVDEERRVHPTVRYRALVAFFSVLNVALSAALVLTSPASAAADAAALCGLAVLQAFSSHSVARLLHSARPVSRSGAEPYIVLNFLSLAVAASTYNVLPVLLIAVVTLASVPAIQALCRLGAEPAAKEAAA